MHRIDSEEELYNALLGLEPSASNPLIIEQAVVGRQNSLEIIVIGGVPAWASATRRSHGAFTVQSTPGLAWSVTLPRETDDPADPIVRQMGFAALRAMGVTDGMVTVDWVRRPDGSAIITDIHTTPPPSHIFSLMQLSHGADPYRAWANAVVNGVFGPIPRLYASGVVFLRGQGKGDTVSSVDGWEAVMQELGDVIVEARLPETGAKHNEGPEGDGWVLVRHAETARVDAALQRIAAGVRVKLGK